MNKKDLFILAKEAMKNSYAQYSQYNVGAILLTKNGNVYKGCNIENASYSVTNCAERTAILTYTKNKTLLVFIPESFADFSFPPIA